MMIGYAIGVSRRKVPLSGVHQRPFSKDGRPYARCS
jgi:hypothetical protein